MSLRSPLGRVLGLGAAKDGVGHWWMQRLTAVALVPLALWFFVSLLMLGTLDYAAVRDWMAAPHIAVLTLLLVLALGYHSRLGIQVVVEDYVHHDGFKVMILVLIDFAHILAAAIGVFAVLKVAFGGAA
jgi:succinate dehydrogenase / fumarate reductase, membrane anchor subunit